MTAKTVQTLAPGDRFTATATNGVEVTLTVAEGTDRYPAIDRMDPNGKSHPTGDLVWVTGTTGSARFLAGAIAEVSA